MYKALSLHENYFMNEVLGVNLKTGNIIFENNNIVKIDGKETSIAINLSN